MSLLVFLLDFYFRSAVKFIWNVKLILRNQSLHKNVIWNLCYGLLWINVVAVIYV